MIMTIIMNVNDKNNEQSLPEKRNELKIMECLEKGNNMNKECTILISQRDAEKNCENRTNNRDECYYQLAVYKSERRLCFKIDDEKIRRGCELNSEGYQGM
jgi:hypothetical protein